MYLFLLVRTHKLLVTRSIHLIYRIHRLVITGHVNFFSILNKFFRRQCPGLLIELHQFSHYQKMKTSWKSKVCKWRRKKKIFSSKPCNVKPSSTFVRLYYALGKTVYHKRFEYRFLPFSGPVKKICFANSLFSSSGTHEYLSVYFATSLLISLHLQKHIWKLFCKLLPSLDFVNLLLWTCKFTRAI